MEIRNTQGQGHRVDGVDITRPNRQGIRRTLDRLEETKEAAREPGKDQVELSSTARELASGAREVDDRAERIADLKAAYEDGSLNSPERIDQAAEGLLDPS